MRLSDRELLSNINWRSKSVCSYRLLVALLVSSLFLACAPDDTVENYPRRTITLICPWAQGGGTDRNSRFWADQLEEQLGCRVVVKNRTGGSGAIGHAEGANADPDGYTLTMITAELSTMHRMGISSLTFRDYLPLAQINADAAAILVREDATWQTLGELLDDIRANPRTQKWTGTAAKGTWDLARAGLLNAADLPVDAVTWVPTDGAAPSITKLLGGHVDVVCCSLPEAELQLQSGELRALAVMSDAPLEEYPGVSTCRAQGVDWVAVGWRGLAVPIETPDAIVAKLEQAVRVVAESEAYRQFMRANKFGIQVRVTEQFTQFLSEQDELWEPVVEAAGYGQ